MMIRHGASTSDHHVPDDLTQAMLALLAVIQVVFCAMQGRSKNGDTREV